jgi:hypothetical protein
MKRNRYMEWTAVWEWLGAIDIDRPVSRENWKRLYHLLDRMWEDGRKDAAIGELVAHAGAVVRLRQSPSAPLDVSFATRLEPRGVGSKTPTRQACRDSRR